MNYPTRKVILLGEVQRQTARTILDNAPFPSDGFKGIEIIFREIVKQRNAEQNAKNWVGVIADFEEQGWLQGRKFSKLAWHYQLKFDWLPDAYEEGITLDDYVKWVELPNGKLEMVGSTTRLTVKGFAQYLEKCMAYGAQELWIKFHVKEGL